jgi:hypothetical protein
MKKLAPLERRKTDCLPAAPGKRLSVLMLLRVAWQPSWLFHIKY